MTGPNLSDWALKHKSFMVFCMVLLGLAGAAARLRQWAGV